MNNRRFMRGLLHGLIYGALLVAGCSALAQDTAEPNVAAAAVVPAHGMVRQGQDLFLGARRFSAGGPACNSCHNVVNDAVIGGGTLAMDLTETFERFGAEGIIETLPRKDAPSPFPVMQAAYQGREITAEEGNALVAFLQEVYDKRATQQPNDIRTKMLLAGIGGVIMLLLLFSLIGKGRKRRSLNQEMFDRQIKTE
ncbi:exported protein of unknown function [Georgfuchsia toluolica]|uniref:Cytochrome c domain-containing protein n=1 Tax=Georgfuchsia toluolica TaxID=424218 RepID=A0A916J418_9PROT|nr:hypothetical protein [Georgfuchsia toluolica]CAG4884197.1 exported protein of unknown function [Georgfuchsia toluolica]